MFMAGGASLGEFADKIVIDLRNRYLLGYTPSDAARDGRHHRITSETCATSRIAQARSTLEEGLLRPRPIARRLGGRAAAA